MNHFFRFFKKNCSIQLVDQLPDQFTDQFTDLSGFKLLKISLALPLISFLFLLASCGGSNTDDLKTQTVSSLSIFPLSITATALNQKFLLNAVVKDTQGQSIAEPGELVWKSSDDTIATVDAFGEVTTHAVGEVSITAILADVSGDSSVSVNESGDVIKGVAKYEDRLYSTAGFIGYAFNFVRYATVELLDESGKVLTTTATNEVGEYELGNIIPDKYSIRLLAEVKAAPAPNFSVRDMNGALYSYKKTSVDSTLIYPFDLGRSLSGTGAFNLLDVAIISSEYSTQVLNADVNDLQIYWESGYALNATYYCTGYDSYDCFNDKGIYVTSEAPSSDNGGQPDTDEFDDDVIMHEFGHFLTGNYSVDDSVGGPHLITQNDSDLRLSWSEGWGTFFPSAVKYWLKTTRPELVSSKTAVTTYVDTVGDAAYLFHDIKAAETDKSYYYASSEAAVSNILWNILETTSLGMSQIWDVLVNYFPTSERPTSLPVFWDGLLASDLYDPNELPALSAIFEARDVYYSSDANEDDNTIATATVQAVGVTPAVTSTIYSDTLVADVDFVEFTGVAGKTYRISTSDLYNGIDTKIRLFDNNGTLLGENDDADPSAYYRYDADVYDWRVLNNTTAMSSSLDVTLSTDGQYYVEVSFADKQNTTYDFVGHYGSYKLNITEVN